MSRPPTFPAPRACVCALPLNPPCQTRPHPSRARRRAHCRAPAPLRPIAPHRAPLPAPHRASQLDDFLTALAKCETRATAAKVKARAEHLSQHELPQLASNAAAAPRAAQLAPPPHDPRTSRSARPSRQNILGQNPDSWGHAIVEPPWGSSRDAALTPCGPGPMGTPRSRRTSREIQSSGPWQGTFRPSCGADAEGQS